MEKQVDKDLSVHPGYVRRLENTVEELNARIKVLRTFIENAEAGMYVTDYSTGEILYANRKMLILFDSAMADPAEVFGKICWKMLDKKNKGRCAFCPFMELINEDGTLRDPYTWEHYFPAYDMWLRIISQVIVWADGRLAQINTFYDISETKKAQQEVAALEREKEQRKMMETLQGVLDVLPTPIRIIDRETAEISYVNKACAKMFGYVVPEDMLGLRITDTVPPMQSNGADSGEAIMEILRSDKPVATEFEYINAAGHLIEGRVEVCSIEFKGRMCRLGTIVDLAAEKQKQRMLQNAARKEREANQLKSNFLSNMSHEVRTPMNAIIGLTEIELRKKHGKESFETYKKINISAKSLLQIVNDILDLSKVEANKLDIYSEKFDFEDVLNNALLVVSPRLEGKRVELMLDSSLELPKYVIGDKTRLWQVLKNFLDNAAKFTKTGYILLSVAEDKARATEETIYISFVVSDSGVGMNKDQLHKAFLPYEQISNHEQSKYIGTGLGLPLSKRICELLGGELKLESCPGQGTTIGFTLPFARTGTDHTEPARTPDLSGLKVLLVDDSELSLRIIGGLLKGSGADYMVARSGKEAALLVSRFPRFDVLLLDYIMDGENGFDALQKIRDNSPSMPKAVMVTAYGSRIEHAQLEEFGIAEIIEKPFVPSHFYKKILSAAGLQDDIAEQEPNRYTRFQGARVLVCEDDAINQMVAEGMLRQFGIDAAFADNGKHAIEILGRGESFDLILMDIHMPVMDGYEATRFIRSDREFDETPIISLTADAMSEAVGKCRACGMNGYLSKPFVMDDFHDMLLKWLPEDKRVPGVDTL